MYYGSQLFASHSARGLYTSSLCQVTFSSSLWVDHISLSQGEWASPWTCFGQWDVSRNGVVRGQTEVLRTRVILRTFFCFLSA